MTGSSLLAGGLAAPSAGLEKAEAGGAEHEIGVLVVVLVFLQGARTDSPVMSSEGSTTPDEQPSRIA